MYHEYPYTTYYHDIDRLCGACHACGYRLDIQGDYLRLVKKDGSVVSSVQITYADKAAHDVEGKAIEAYIFDVSEDGTHIVFTQGDNTYKTITVPYSVTAGKDVQNKDILNYAYTLSISGDKLRIVKGDGSAYELTIPYAVQASETVDGKAIDTFAASLEVDGNELVLRDAKGRQLNRITVEYAETAGLAEEANHALNADHADEADHAEEADAADYATLSTDATNAVESVTIVGDTMVFSTYGGQTFTITCPYSVKSQKDDAGNTIKTTYVANIAQDSTTGEISFYDGTGNVITTLTPTASIASYDSYSNLIADYIKTIVVSQGSDYVTVTHGTGVADSIKIDYSNRAWKDTNDNVIKNTYVKRMECIEDVEDGKYKLVAFNGDDPEAELWRIILVCDEAAHDLNGKAITSYVANVQINANNNPIFVDGEGNQVAGISGTVVPNGSLTGGTLASCTYDASTETITFNAGAFPTFSGSSSTVVFAQ